MGRQVFTAGEILTAANMNDLGDATVMVFDDATARTTAIPTPVEGMVTYLKDEDEVTVFDGSAFTAVGPGKILQVVSVPKLDVFTTASTTYTDVTDFEATITPTSTSSKVLVIVSGAISNTVNGGATTRLQVVRASTPIGNNANNNSMTMSTSLSDGNRNVFFANTLILDTPSSTSSTVYKIQMQQSSGLGVLNRSGNVGSVQGISSITLMEVAG